MGRETLKMEKESLSGQLDPNSTGVLDTRIKNKPHCCARVLGFLQGRWAGKPSKWRRSLFQGNVTPTVPGPRSEDQEQAPLLCTCPRLFAGKMGREGGQGKVGRETLNIGKDRTKMCTKRCMKVCTKSVNRLYGTLE